MNLHRALTLQGLQNLTAPGDIYAEALGNDKYKVYFTVHGEHMVKLMQVLTALSAVSDQIYTQVDRAHVRELADNQVQQLRDDERAIAQCYWQYREQYKHRDCIAIVQEKVAELTQGRRSNYTKTDIGYCVKSYPKETLALPGPEQEVGCPSTMTVSMS
jgi:hypothetical protein